MKAANLALINGNVLTLDPQNPAAQAVAVRDGHILAVGENDAIQDHIGPHTEVIDLNGRTLVPGFNDSHLHLLAYGLTLQWLNLREVTSVADLAAMVRAQGAITPPGEWIIGRGWDQNRFTEGRFPTREDLDQAAPNHPVSLTRICGHASVVNTAALTLAGIDRNTANPPGGEIGHRADGEPDGLLWEHSAMNLTSRFFIPPAYPAAKAALKLAMAKMVAAGITSLTTDDLRYSGSLPATLAMYREIWAEGGPAVRANLCVSDFALDELLAQGLRTGSGDDAVTVGPMKIFQDGGLGGLTAVLREPYASAPESRGIPIHTQAELNDLVGRGHAAGMQVAIHAIGDAAIDACLNAIEKAQAAHPRPDPRHRIIHYCLVDDTILRRTIDLGAVVELQPRFVALNGAITEKHLGPERARRTYAWKTILAAGIPASGGSDCPIERFEPLLGIHNAVNRQVDSVPGLVFQPEERISVEDALRLFTSGSAYISREEDRKGTLTPGKLGDMVVLSDDPSAVPPETIRDIKVEMTVIGGKIVYCR